EDGIRDDLVTGVQTCALPIYAELYISRIVCLHGVPKTITSDRGPQFVARFWEQLQESLGTKLIHSSAYHPQTSGQVERVNQVLEDMLLACVITLLNHGMNVYPWQSSHTTIAIRKA